MAQNIITGTAGRDRLYGTAGDDLINGLEGKDHLYGLAGDDDLHGGLDDDMLWGGAGNDLYFVDTPQEKVFESRNEGIDTVVSSISYELGNNVERLVLSGGTAPLQATGNDLDNELIGNVGDNVLAGGLGNDTLVGEAGSDTFLFDTKLGPDNIDVFYFAQGEDVIALDRRIFAAADSGDRIVFNLETGALFYDPDGTGPAVAVQFATLLGVTQPLSAADFIII